MSTHATIETTLDAALEHVARRSFYEPTTIYPLTHGETNAVAYAVDYDNVSSIDLDEIDWTYSDGLTYRGEHLSNRVIDHSGLLEPAEYIDTASHVRFHLADAISELEDGHAVTFSYAVARNTDAPYDCSGVTYDPDYRDQYVYDCDGSVTGIMTDSGELSIDIDAYMIDDYAGWVIVAESAEAR